MKTSKLESGSVSANMSVEELRKTGNSFFGVFECHLSGSLCKVVGDVDDYSFGIEKGDEVYIVGVDEDGDALVAIVEEGDYKNPLVQALDVDDIKFIQKG